MKRNSLILLAVFALALTFSMPASAADQSAKISTNCSSIRQNLKNLQRSDSRARTYFGAIYETFSSKYLKPLNLRLVNNDISSSDLVKLQTAFATARTNFSEDFIDYSKALEDLIATDCRLEPEVFYEKLVKTREKRALVAKDIKELNSHLTGSVKKVEVLKEGLTK
ncbi:hypothetical protein IKL45_00625 [Candidatus Saccharibacteria bacterium]|nr:hypothetical protein [Candidatus Saccharibacteria bacterium]MBR6122937.1 hypothetical protein [Candidatus Saccharibacteria bacterium]